ncbi:MAG: tRNA (adenosine(37)-N6)-threonylcarbamoyltransferase complex transferase subunit TsaD [Salibaculum sp.]|uniref:tRNA (adenosine(37)-N6)-threonylcarbamoyltransferase complex transferase subunit TsaD n=1 Tax=Salibaculum sp. TaxID=2855480 RepID=UPI002870398F|nr:tRNA (adenosine(37)-N6)-threonylcarbamoyltransferase complex transferase subunit TsaD [Salibaculum sp.]MDR9428192.1 tRNA (adenosine(37)-N6)-threonylcarbamoyltransferase complex transferase subunit TsaD [Salibaculum sp.]
MNTPLTILGIESSCDDTAAAVVRGQPGQADVLSSVVSGQADLHAGYGGIVPEIAARAHAEKLDFMVEQSLLQADLTLTDLDAIAVTAGPGLIGGVLSGVMCAKGLAAARGLPLLGINHLAGHALTPQLSTGLPFPYLTLLVSGGHCQFLLVRGHADYTRLGGTIDDAPGEAFDKAARLLGLPQPGGPAIETAAQDGNPARVKLPRPLLDRDNCNMSFSGLKTAILRARDDLLQDNGGLTRQDQADLAASFQAAVVDVLVEKSRRAVVAARHLVPGLSRFSVAGGVAANRTIRGGLDTVCADQGLVFSAPPLALCTDNAAMVAYAGLLRRARGEDDDMTLAARPRWPLDAISPGLLGSGKKGAKA